jgi:hypothetical protein
MSHGRDPILSEVKQDNAFSLCDSIQLFETFFWRKSINKIATLLTEDIMKKRGYTEFQARQMSNAVYLALIAYQGSLLTSGSSFGVEEMLKLCQYDETEAYCAGLTVGFAISLALDLNPLGVAKTVLSTAGGVAGKWCSQWAYQKVQPTLENVKESVRELRARF